MPQEVYLGLSRSTMNPKELEKKFTNWAGRNLDPKTFQYNLG
jgi:hypothetical protein